MVFSSVLPKNVIPFSILLAALTIFSKAQETDKSQLEKETRHWANVLLNDMVSSNQRKKWQSPEFEPGYTYHQEKLRELGPIGWSETFKRFKEGRLAIMAAREIIGFSPRGADAAQDTAKILSLLKDLNFKRRAWIPQLIKRRDEARVNDLLHPFLVDGDPEVRAACLLHLSFRNPKQRDIESAISLLSDKDRNVRFRALHFLQRATGHLCFIDGIYTDSEQEWSAWWEMVKAEPIPEIVKKELNILTNLLSHTEQKIREDAGIILVAHSGQIFYGFHNSNGKWWGANNGKDSTESWQEWLRIRYAPGKNLKLTTWEFHYTRKNPTFPVEALRATISLNIRDLSSPERRVRSMARMSIIDLLGEASPFRSSNSSGEGEWLNQGMIDWWKQRMAAEK